MACPAATVPKLASVAEGFEAVMAEAIVAADVCGNLTRRDVLQRV